MIEFFMKRFFTALLFVPLLCSEPALAQIRQIGVRGLALERADPLPERYIKVKDGYELIQFLYSQPVQLIIAYTESALPLFEKKKNDEGEEAYEIAEKVSVPASAKGILLLGWKGEEGPRYLAIDDNFPAAKYNNWLMINAASKPVAFRIGKENKPFIVKASSAENYKVNVPEGRGAAVLGQAEMEGEAKTFYSTYWPIREKERSIVIFFEREDRMRLRKISDSLFVPKKSPDEE